MPTTLGSTCLLFMGVLAASGASLKKKCDWSEYYDENMNDCGPCREICDQMAATGTEEQCQAQCREYLISRKCTYVQYYDQWTESCESCPEICDNQNVTGTQQQCTDSCAWYLLSQTCTEEEYFNETLKKCASCAVLCDGTGVSNDSCRQNCNGFLERRRVDLNSKGNHEIAAKEGTTQTSFFLSWHPGVIATVVIASVLIVVPFLVMVIILVRARKGKGSHRCSMGGDSQANEAEAEDNTSLTSAMLNVCPRQGWIFPGQVNQTATAAGRDGTQVVVEEVAETAKVSIQVSLDGRHATDVFSGSRVDPDSEPLLRPPAGGTSLTLDSGAIGVEESQGVWRRMAEGLSPGEGNQQEYAIPELDPLAPSSAGFEQTRREPPCSLEERAACGV